MAEVESIVRRARLGRWLLVGVVAATCLGTVYAIAVNVNQGSDITNVHNDVTKIEHTACAKFAQHPHNTRAATACAALRVTIARTEPIKNPCTSYQRVTGKRGRNCGRFFVNPGKHGGPESIDTPSFKPSSSNGSPPVAGGGAAQPASGVQHPSSHDGGAQGGGGETSPPPDSTAPTGSPAGGDQLQHEETPARSTSSSSTSTMESAIESTPTVEGPTHPVLESAGAAVQEVGEAAKETGENVGGVLCGVTGALRLSC